MSTRTAANRLGLKSTQAVIKRLAAGSLSGVQQDDGRWLVELPQENPTCLPA